MNPESHKRLHLLSPNRYSVLAYAWTPFLTASATATGWANTTTFGNVTTFSGGATAFGTGVSVRITRRKGRFYVIKYVN
jgi:hypothetical protein